MTYEYEYTYLHILYHVIVYCYYSIIFITTIIDYLFCHYWSYLFSIFHQCSSALRNQKKGIQRMDTEGEVSRYLWRILWKQASVCPAMFWA